MSKTFTKLSSLALAATILGSGFSINANAAELDSQVDSNEFKKVELHEVKQNVGVNEIAPGLGDPNQMVTFGTSKPTSVIDLSTYGRKSFEGYLTTARSLYTNDLYTGKSSFKIYVRNTGTDTLTFKVKRKDAIFDNTVGTYEVNRGVGGTVTVSSLAKSSNYYIEFIGPANFSGWIE